MSVRGHRQLGGTLRRAPNRLKAWRDGDTCVVGGSLTGQSETGSCLPGQLAITYSVVSLDEESLTAYVEPAVPRDPIMKLAQLVAIPPNLEARRLPRHRS